MEFDITEYLAGLSRYEVLESFYLARNALVGDMTVLMTILFAYVTVAYLVSAKLTRWPRAPASTEERDRNGE